MSWAWKVGWLRPPPRWGRLGYGFGGAGRSVGMASPAAEVGTPRLRVGGRGPESGDGFAGRRGGDASATGSGERAGE
jgi:hypothetical protein